MPFHSCYSCYSWSSSVYDALVLQFWILSKIHQQTKLIPGGFQVVVNLRTMFIAKILERLDLHDYFFKTDEIRDVFLLKGFPFVDTVREKPGL